MAWNCLAYKLCLDKLISYQFGVHSVQCSECSECTLRLSLIVYMEIRDSSQIFTTAPIILLSNYFRQTFFEIDSCAVSLLNNIWVQVEHSQLQQLNLQKFNCSSSSVQAGCESNCGDQLNTSLKTGYQIFCTMKKYCKIIFQIQFSQ